MGSSVGVTGPTTIQCLRLAVLLFGTLLLYHPARSLVDSLHSPHNAELTILSPIGVIQGPASHRSPGKYPQCQCEKQPEEGCGFLAPLQDLVNQPGYIEGLQQPPCILLDYWLSVQEPLFSVILTVHNQSRLLQKNLQALLDYTTGLWELIIVFDFCTDNSQDLALALLQNARHPDSLTHVLLIEQPTPVWETSANNIGMRASHPSATLLVLVQDDMQMITRGWNSILAVPAHLYSDVVAVSGRCAHMAYSIQESTLPEKVGRCEGTELDRPLNASKETMCTFHVRDTVNRGPLLLVADKTRALGYFDEVNFYLGDDDHDFMTRAWHQYGWVAGWMPLDFISMTEDGVSRRKQNYTIEEISYLKARKERITGGFHSYNRTEDHNEDRIVPEEFNCLDHDNWWFQS